MIYKTLFDRVSRGKRPVAGVIGTGSYATAIVAQSSRLQRLDIPIIADVDVAKARNAYRQAGIPDEKIILCDSRSQALDALERGDKIILSDALIMMELPIDLVVEATGSAEIGALHALTAIQNGKHVVMVTKEADVTVGPILKHLADRAGLVYTAVDGDQHGLLIGLVEWVRELGLNVICGGKFSDTEVVFDQAQHIVQRTILRKSHKRQLNEDDATVFGKIESGQATEKTMLRSGLLAGFHELGGWDLGEMTIAANATGLTPDIETFHGPIAHITEIPEVLCAQSEGGILNQSGVIDTVIPLRSPMEAGQGGGVFVVVDYDSDHSRKNMIRKGLICNHRGSATLIYRPYHLLGVETPISMMCAALLGIPTGASEYHPRFDLIGRADVAFKAGDRHPDDYQFSLQSLVRPACPLEGDKPLPFHLGNGNQFTVNIPAGTVITAEMVLRPKDSALWSLREQQDRYFFDGAKT